MKDERPWLARLDRMDRAQAGLSDGAQSTFNNVMLGALAALVSDAQWDEALTLARTTSGITTSS